MATSTDAAPTPRFCPACRLDGEPGAVLCATCGGRLQPQGFCPICEGFLRHEPGTLCPKHDLPLEPGPPALDPAAEPGGPVSWRTVARFALPAEAEGPRLRLEAEGIPTFLEGERMGDFGIYQIATGGVKLQVPADLVADARVLLSQSWAIPEAASGDLDDAFEELAPEPWARRARWMKLAIILFLLGPFLLVLLTSLMGYVLG